MCNKNRIIFRKLTNFQVQIMNFYSMDICNFRTQHGMRLVQNANKGYWRHFVIFVYFVCHFYACPTRFYGADLCLFC